MQEVPFQEDIDFVAVIQLEIDLGLMINPIHTCVLKL
jgi:hypothetical protein